MFISGAFDKLKRHIGRQRWLSLSKPPASLAFSCGRFDASMLRQAQQPLTMIVSKKPFQNYK